MKLRPGQTDRRQLLIYIGSTAALAGLAGCTTSGSGEDNPTETSTDNRNSTATPAETGTPEPSATPETGAGDYAGLKRVEVDTEEGMEAWVNGIERDGNTYTFHGGIKNEQDERVDAEVWSELLYDLPEDEPVEYEIIAEAAEYFEPIGPGEEEIFEIEVENHDEQEPTHWALDGQYYSTE